MDSTRRSAIVGLVAGLVFVAWDASAQSTSITLTPEQMEVFLLKAKMISSRVTGVGVTDSRRASFTDGTLTHDVHIQSVNISKPVFEAGKHTELNFKDSYRYNIAAFRLARLIGLTTVPMSVERAINGKLSAVTWWVDGVQMDEKERLKRQTMGPDPVRTSNQVQVMRVWDELIQNRDRNQGNILWTADWTLWLIDHTRAFRIEAALLKPDQLVRCDRGLLERLRALTEESIAEAVGDSLSRDERRAVLARRDLLVKHFEERIMRIGEEAVLFDLYGAAIASSGSRLSR